MIKNGKQAAITKVKLEQLKLDLTEFKKTQGTKLHPVRFKLGENAFQGLIKDLTEQLDEYIRLSTNPINYFKDYELKKLANLLTGVRLAKNMSQKELAEKLGIQEQQIQRYEQDDYTKASWSRILEVHSALGLEIKLMPFEVPRKSNVKKVFRKSSPGQKWRHPKNIKSECVMQAAQLTKRRQSLFF